MHLEFAELLLRGSGIGMTWNGRENPIVAQAQFLPVRFTHQHVLNVLVV